jgi:hypothetical protein
MLLRMFVISEADKEQRTMTEYESEFGDVTWTSDGRITPESAAIVARAQATPHFHAELDFGVPVREDQDVWFILDDEGVVRALVPACFTSSEQEAKAFAAARTEFETLRAQLAQTQRYADEVLARAEKVQRDLAAARQQNEQIKADYQAALRALTLSREQAHELEDERDNARQQNEQLVETCHKAASGFMALIDFAGDQIPHGIIAERARAELEWVLANRAAALLATHVTPPPAPGDATPKER